MLRHVVIAIAAVVIPRSAMSMPGSVVPGYRWPPCPAVCAAGVRVLRNMTDITRHVTRGAMGSRLLHARHDHHGHPAGYRYPVWWWCVPGYPKQWGRWTVCTGWRRWRGAEVGRGGVRDIHGFTMRRHGGGGYAVHNVHGFMRRPWGGVFFQKGACIYFHGTGDMPRWYVDMDYLPIVPCRALQAVCATDIYPGLFSSGHTVVAVGGAVHAGRPSAPYRIMTGSSSNPAIMAFS